MNRSGWESLASEGFALQLETFGETWARTRTTETGTHPDTGAPQTTPAEADVTLTVAWRRGEQPEDYRADAAGAVKAVPGTLQAGDVLEHATHGTFRVVEDGPRRYGGYERAEIVKA